MCAISSERSVFASADRGWSDTVRFSANNHLNFPVPGRVETSRALFCATAHLLNRGREDGLEMRALHFPRNDSNIDFSKTGIFKQMQQMQFTESEPAIGVELARFFKAVA